jgi:hypothetical protein
MLDERYPGDTLGDCNFPFGIDGVPATDRQYGREISHRGKVFKSREELARDGWHYDINLGS